MRSARGQSSLEYLGLLAVVATLVVAGAATAEGAAIARRVSRELARAVCLVGRGDCARDREPCVLSAHADHKEGHITVMVFRVGGGHEVLVERRSDGTYAVTDVVSGEGGLDLGTSLRGGVSMKGSALALGGEARAAILGHVSRGRTWVVATRRDAEALVARLPLHGPAADETYGEKGWSVRLGAGLSAGDLAGGGVEIGAADIYGTRRIAATGHEVIYVKERQQFTAALEAGLGRLGGGGDGGKRGGTRRPAGGGDPAAATGDDGGTGASAHVDADALRASLGYDDRREAVYGIERDRQGRPVSLSITTVGEYDASVDLPGRLQPIAGLLAAGAQGRRAYQLEQRLDLTDPENLAVAAAVLRQITSPRPNFSTAVSVSRALQRRLDVAGTAEARTYAVEEATDAVDLAGRFAGVGAGVGGAHTVRDTRLLTATSRGVDGQWIRREDCVAA
ncbi:MAG: hypothetical protein HZB46_10990 [Solirubrobacterales bacterium]|nr:hypothetical protein [Solirubrobacterales bacterium]